MSHKAWMRAVPESFTRALVRDGAPHLDVERARLQQAGYRTLLEDAGYTVTMLDADERFPDSPFIEDALVLIGEVAVVTRPGAPTRRGETETISEAIAGHFARAAIEAPGTLDGGDVLQMGDQIFVGRSARTNREAISQLEALGGELGRTVTTVGVRESVLHLKSAVAMLDDETVLIARGAIDEAAFTGYRVLYQDVGDPGHSSVLRLHDDRLVATASARGTISMLQHARYDVVAIDASEFQAADGGLTCLSVLS